MALKFGTSGLRGLVTEMTPEAVAQYTHAFLSACDSGAVLCVGQDLRPSSARIADNVVAAARQVGMRVLNCGPVPTPALALAAQAHRGGAVMVTGSHIPADRNGLKFYTSAGEITKADETAILSSVSTIPTEVQGTPAALDVDDQAEARFIARYVAAFGPTALTGQRIGLYAHSAVGRDILAQILSNLGAVVIEVGRSDVFIPVDTEAVDQATRAQIREWVKTHKLDALVSTDGDSDRPLLADETGTIVPGDIMGQITADALGAEVVVTPISSNSGVTLKGFEAVIRTRIGSPFVIAGMEAASGAVVGYEANGGFLLGFEACGPVGPIAPLMTRDCTLPLLAVLYAARDSSVAARVAKEPPVVTLSDRLQDVSQEKSQLLITRLLEDAAARTTFLAPLGRTEVTVDLTDGLRMILNDGAVVHIRPSGNAPELRAYVETQDLSSAKKLLNDVLTRLQSLLVQDCRGPRILN